MSLLAVRQSTISSKLFPWIDREYETEEEEEIAKALSLKRMNVGTEIHEDVQSFYEDHDGVGEANCQLETSILALKGHIDVEMDRYIIEVKTNSKKGGGFSIYKSYFFQMAVYFLATRKPVLFAGINVETGDSMLRLYSISNEDAVWMEALINNMVMCYHALLTLDDMDQDGRYDTKAERKQIYDRVLLNSYDLAHIFSDSIIPIPAPMDELWNSYLESRGYRRFM